MTSLERRLAIISARVAQRQQEAAELAQELGLPLPFVVAELARLRERVTALSAVDGNVDAVIEDLAAEEGLSPQALRWEAERIVAR